jgi:hypothetical protein
MGGQGQDPTLKRIPHSVKEPIILRLGWKLLAETNALAYWCNNFNITGPFYYKTLYGLNCCHYVISWSVCYYHSLPP